MPSRLERVLRVGQARSTATGVGCEQEREDLRAQVEGMEALRESNSHLRSIVRAQEDRLIESGADATQLLERIRAEIDRVRAEAREDHQVMNKFNKLLGDPNHVWASSGERCAADGHFRRLMYGQGLFSQEMASLRQLERLAQRIRAYGDATRDEREMEDEALARGIAASDLQDV